MADGLQIDIVIDPSKAEAQVREFTRTAESIFAASEARKSQQTRESTTKTKQINGEYQDWWKRSLGEQNSFEKMLRQAHIEDIRRMHRIEVSEAKQAAAQIQAAQKNSAQFRVAGMLESHNSGLRIAKENLAQLESQGIRSGVVFDKATTAVKLFETGNARGRGEVHKMVASLASLTFEATGAIYGLTALTAVMFAPAIAGAKFMSSIENATFGMTGILLSMGKIEGKSLTFAQAFSAATQNVKELQKESIKYGVSLEKLVEVNRAALGGGMARRGMNPNDIREMASVGAVATGMLGLNSQQYVQEVRDILQGGIQAASSTLATSLGLNDKILNDWAKQGTEVFRKNVMDRFKGFADAAEEFQKSTLSGSWNRLTASLNMMLVDKGGFDALKKMLNDLTDSIATIDKATGDIKFNEDLVAQVKSIWNGAVMFAKALKTVFDIFVALLPVLTLIAGAMLTIWAVEKIMLWGAAVTTMFTTVSTAGVATATGLRASAMAIMGPAGWIGLAIFGIYTLAEHFGLIDRMFTTAEERLKKFKDSIANASQDALQSQLDALEQESVGLRKAFAGLNLIGRALSTYHTDMADNLNKQQAIRDLMAKNQVNIDTLAKITGDKADAGADSKDNWTSRMAQIKAEMEAREDAFDKYGKNLTKVEVAWAKLTEDKKAWAALGTKKQAIETAEYGKAQGTANELDTLAANRESKKIIAEMGLEYKKVEDSLAQQLTLQGAIDNMTGKGLYNEQLRLETIKEEQRYNKQILDIQKNKEFQGEAQKEQMNATLADAERIHDLITKGLPKKIEIELLSADLKKMVDGLSGALTSAIFADNGKSFGDNLANALKGGLAASTTKLISALLINALATQMDITVRESEKVSTGDWVMAIIQLIATQFGNEAVAKGKSTSIAGTLAGATSGAKNEMWQMDAQWFTAQQNWTMRTNMSTAELNKYSEVIKESRQSMIVAGDALGYVNTATKTLSINMTTSGDASDELANTIGESLLPALVLFQQEGETLAQTADRMTESFKATGDFISALGVSSLSAFGGFGLQSAAARDSLISASGGLSEFTSKSQSFIDNFLTPAQKMAPALDEVGRTFSKLGISGISTNEQFAELVRAQTELGNTTVVAELLTVADSFNEITTSAADANAELAALLDKNTFRTLVDYTRALMLGGSTSAADAITTATIAAPSTLAQEQAGTAAFTAANASAINRAMTEPVPVKVDETTVGVSKFQEVLDGILHALNALMDTVTSWLKKIWDVLGSIWMWIKPIWDGIWDILTGIWDSIKQLVGGGASNMTGTGGAPNIFNPFSWSDPRLKTDISPTGIVKNGFQLYDFAYKSDPLHQMYRGVMADEVKRSRPDAVHRMANGYDTVNYSSLGLRMEKLASYAIGSNYIPTDMIAQVHQGEEITPRPYVDMQRNERSETNRLLEALRAELQAIGIPLVQSTKGTFKLMKKFDGDGLPETRVVTA